MSEQANPTVARRRLAAVLRSARERHRHSLDELARFLEVSAPQASRLDSGARGFRTDDVRRLAHRYEFDATETDRLLALAEESRRRAWWQQVDLHDAYRTLIGMEQGALAIAEYGANVVPGLLQTRQYARVAAALGPELASDLDDSVFETAAEIRMRRQSILDRPSPPRLTVVIDEAVLARGPRDATVRRDQLVHLRDACDRPGIAVQVIGFEYGLYTGALSQFILCGMESEVPDLFYSQGLRDEVASTEAEVLRRYRLIWNELRALALDEFASKNRIERYLTDV